MKTIISRTFLALTLILLSSFTLADPVFIDVRTVEEYQEDHIEGHTNIPLATIEAEGTLSMIDKDEEINLYCRSGRRADVAMAVLKEAGYTNVKNLGGIEDVRALSSEATAQ